MDTDADFDELSIGSYTPLYEETSEVRPHEWKKLQNRAKLECLGDCENYIEDTYRHAHRGSIYELYTKTYYGDQLSYPLNDSNNSKVLVLTLNGSTIFEIQVEAKDFSVIHFDIARKYIYFSIHKTIFNHSLFRNRINSFQFLDFSKEYPLLKPIKQVAEFRSYPNDIHFVGVYKEFVLVRVPAGLVWLRPENDDFPNTKPPKLPKDDLSNRCTPAIRGDLFYYLRNSIEQIPLLNTEQLSIFSLTKQKVVASLDVSPYGSKFTSMKIVAIHPFKNFVILRSDVHSRGLTSFIAVDPKFKSITSTYDCYLSSQVSELVASGKDLFCTFVDNARNTKIAVFRVWTVIKGEIVHKEFIIDELYGYNHSIEGNVCSLRNGLFEFIARNGEAGQSPKRFRLKIS